jgi:hypothetical protein
VAKEIWVLSAAEGIGACGVGAGAKPDSTGAKPDIESEQNRIFDFDCEK